MKKMIPEIKRENIKEIRKILNLNQQQFANEVGASVSTVSLWERKKGELKHIYKNKINKIINKYKRKGNMNESK